MLAFAIKGKTVASMPPATAPCSLNITPLCLVPAGSASSAPQAPQPDPALPSAPRGSLIDYDMRHKTKPTRSKAANEPEAGIHQNVLKSEEV